MCNRRKLTVVTPHGFCSGVARAVATAEAVLAACPGERVYCLNEIVHNRQVVSRLTDAGMVFVSDPAEVPQGARLLFSAHGVSPEVRRQAAARGARVIDATCPFVMKVHHEVVRFAAQGACVVCIGHRHHEEVVGVAGEAPDQVRIVECEAEAESLDVPSTQPVAVVTQTTLDAARVEGVMRVLRRRFGARLIVPASTDVCYATRNRQQAVCELARVCGRVLVLGSANSSNSLRLVETALAAGAAEAELVSDLARLDALRWNDRQAVGITSGASTPESFLNEAVAILCSRHNFAEPERLEVVKEQAHMFRLPALG
jgi:4-hydroxy-3-methylbut-2-enyl diphosphate reductase